MKQEVYRVSLLHRSPNYEYNLHKRDFLWTYFLQIPDVICEYAALRDKIIQNPEIIERVEEVIDIDVQRSFINNSFVQQKTLSNILKTYAFYNPEIEYC
jgi:hypothetical protein